MWKTVKLGDVCELIGGGTPSKKNADYYGGEIPWATVRDMHSDELKETEIQITESGLQNSSSKVIPANNIVIASRVGLGKVCLLTQDTAINQDLRGVIPKKPDTIYVRYLLYWFKSIAQKIISAGRGATVHGVTLPFLKTLELSLPPLAEQQRIVAKLDAAFAEIDRAIELCEQKALNAEYIYANKLTQIFEEKGDDWTSCSLKEITSKIGSGATPRGGKAAYKEVGLSLIRSMNVYDMDFSWKELAKIDNEQAQKLSNVEVEQDDVLLNITGASVARCTIVPTDALPARVNQHVAIIRTDKSRLIPKLLAYGLVARINKETLLGVGNSAGATRQAITKRDIEEFVFSFPMKIEAQRNLIEAISHIKHEAIKLAGLYRKKQNNFIALKSAILNQELQPPQSEAA